ncbi:MAG: DMT family transporter [Akkermansiaceae bacterium]|nr:DMT family transporter [Akkermansiaceae bacterium]
MRHYLLKGHICALGAVLLFGLMSPMCKLAMQNGAIDGVLLAFFRVSGAALLFWLISPLTPREKIARNDWLPLLGMSLCGMVINQFLYVLGIQYTSPTNACVVGTSTPVMTFILAALFLHHRVTLLRVGGFLLASVGALVLILGSGGGLSGHPLGDTLCLISQFSAACYFVFFGGVLRRYHPVTIMKWLFLFAAVLTLQPMRSRLVALPSVTFSLQELFAIAYVVIGGSFFSYLLLIVGQRRLDPPTVAAYNYVQPIIAAVVGIMLGLDILTWQKCLSLLLIAAGVLLITKNAE